MSERVADQLRTDDGKIDARSLNTGRNPDDRPISRRDCYRLRVALLYGAEIREHTAATHFARSGAYYHAHGRCTHDHAVPPIRHTGRGGHGDTGEWVIDQ